MKDDSVKPEVKKIPKRLEEKKKEEEKAKESEKETGKSPSRAPIELRSRSPVRQPQDSRADSAQAFRGKDALHVRVLQPCCAFKRPSSSRSERC